MTPIPHRIMFVVHQKNGRRIWKMTSFQVETANQTQMDRKNGAKYWWWDQQNWCEAKWSLNQDTCWTMRLILGSVLNQGTFHWYEFQGLKSGLWYHYDRSPWNIDDPLISITQHEDPFSDAYGLGRWCRNFCFIEISWDRWDRNHL